MTDIQDIALHENEAMSLVASCSRDRTVQLFCRRSDQWELIQTLDEHSASVCSLLFAENGEKLISCSSDITIHIRQLVTKEVDGQVIIGAIPVRIITLKASPVSMAACSNDPMSFVVSLLDRTVATYELSSGRMVTSFRATDGDGGDAVVLDALIMGSPMSGSPTLLVGISGTDKSVRVYDGYTGLFLDREWGHTAAVTDVGLLESPGSDQRILISTGSDGTIMIWDLSPRPPDLEAPLDLSASSREASPPKESASARPPLRRVLSKAEMAEFQRASPAVTPTGRGSPPRQVRRRTSRYGLSSQSPTVPPMPNINPKHFASTSEETSTRRSPRTRSRSPPPSPKAKDMRRPSLASLHESRGRTKTTGNFSEFGTLNMATEQASRTLRAYRKKLVSAEAVKEDVLKELDRELRLTAVALGEKSLKAKAISEIVMTGLLDSYSERLVSLFDEKLRLTKVDSGASNEERPKTAGNAVASASIET